MRVDRTRYQDCGRRNPRRRRADRCPPRPSTAPGLRARRGSAPVRQVDPVDAWITVAYRLIVFGPLIASEIERLTAPSCEVGAAGESLETEAAATATDDPKLLRAPLGSGFPRPSFLGHSLPRGARLLCGALRRRLPGARALPLRPLHRLLCHTLSR